MSVTAPSLMPLLLAMGTLAACGGSEPERPPVTVVSPEVDAAAEETEEHQTAADGRFAEVAFTCCEVESVAGVVAAYDELGDALAADDGSAAAAKAAALVAATEAALADPAAAGSAAELQQIATLSARMVSLGTDMEGLRAELGDLVQPAIGLALAHEGGATKYAISYCPMATPPGRWLQDSTPLANPYYGSKMLRCGVFETRAEAGFAAAEGEEAAAPEGEPAAPAAPAAPATQGG